MKIKKFIFNGFRGFKNNTTIELNPDVNVFVGINGAGKSTVLDLIGGMLSYFISRVSSDRTYHNYFDEDDINDESATFNTNISVEFEEQLLEWSVEYGEKRTNSGRLLPKNHDVSNTELSSIRGRVRRDNEYTLPVIAFYHAHRMMKGVQRAKTGRQAKDMVDVLYEEAIKQEISSFESFESWFLSEKNYENQVRLKKQNSFRSRALEVVEKAIELFFNEIGDKQTNYSHLDLFYDDSPEVTRWNVVRDPELSLKKNGKLIKLNKMSDGEKMVLVIVCDIARRLSIANPKESGQGILEGNGIVIIDEVELHLHPAWQRKIVSALSSVFPNIQFIFSTHSPQVLSGVLENRIFGIDDFNIFNITSLTKGRDSNSILWDVYGVPERPKEDAAKFSDFYSALEDETPNQDTIKSILTQLTEVYGESDSEVLKAKLHFEMEFGLE